MKLLIRHATAATPIFVRTPQEPSSIELDQLLMNINAVKEDSSSLFNARHDADMIIESLTMMMVYQPPSRRNASSSRYIIMNRYQVMLLRRHAGTCVKAQYHFMNGRRESHAASIHARAHYKNSMRAYYFSKSAMPMLFTRKFTPCLSSTGRRVD